VQTKKKPCPLEVYQFGGGRDVTGAMAHVLGTVLPELSTHLDRKLRSPYRAFITDTQGGGMGSHFGLRVGFFADAEEGLEESSYFRQHITHELFHEWLGIQLRESDSSLVWFKEGFTEYLSLWQAAAAGLVSRDWFASRLIELQEIARQRSSLGSKAFGDPDVAWRDGDGPNETLAYTGAPLLALVLDAELRQAGQPGLMQLVRDLLGCGETYSLSDIRQWLEDHGLADRYERSIAGVEMPDITDILARIGYELVEEAAPLTYFGLQTTDEMFHWEVLAIDPEGPAAQVDIRVGDVINGYFPSRANAPRIRDVDTRYRFGLDRFEPGIEGTFLGLVRGEEEHQIFLQPELIPGGFLRRLGAGGTALDGFFAFTPH